MNSQRVTISLKLYIKVPGLFWRWSCWKTLLELYS